MERRTVALHCQIFRIYSTDEPGEGEAVLTLHYDPRQYQPLIGRTDKHDDITHIMAMFNGYVIARRVNQEEVDLKAMLVDVYSQLGLRVYVRRLVSALVEFEPACDEQRALLLARAGELH